MQDSHNRIRTMKELKSSLDVARNRVAPSIIINSEEVLRKELEESIGPILMDDDLTETLECEKLRKDKQDLALKKSRLKMLRLKEKVKRVQMVRCNRLDTEPANTFDKDNTKKQNPQNLVFKKVNIGY